MTSVPRPSLPALTGLRFLAALHVVAFHVTPKEGRPAWLGALLDNGPASVTLFFILSGFVLAQAYLGEAADGQVPRRAFWAARIARIYPVYLLGLVLAAPPFFLDVLRREGGLTGTSLQHLVGVGTAVFSLTQAWVPPAACAWNCPGWSLSVEAFFYLLFPVLAAPLVRLGMTGLRWAGAALVVLTALLGGLWLLGDLWLTGDEAARETWAQVGEYAPLIKLPQFLLGVVLGRAFVLRRANTPARGTAVGSFVAAGLALLLLALPWGGSAGAFRSFALTPVFAWLLWTLAWGRGPLAALLARPSVVRLGEASYALYILHIPLAFWLRAVERFSRVGLEARAPWAWCALALTVFVLLSLAVFTRVEEPARRWLRMRLSRPASEPMAIPTGLS